jgi:hypothetical protein
MTRDIFSIRMVKVRHIPSYSLHQFSDRIFKGEVNETIFHFKIQTHNSNRHSRFCANPCPQTAFLNLQPISIQGVKNSLNRGIYNPQKPTNSPVLIYLLQTNQNYFSKCRLILCIISNFPLRSLFLEKFHYFRIAVYF